MANQRITFGEWLPDQPSVTGALVKANNVFSKAIGYGAIPSAVDYSGSASENLTNVVAGRNPDGTTSIFAGSETNLYKLDSSDMSLDDVSGTTYATPNGQRWRFTQFGNRLIAANGFNKLQGWLLGTSTAWADLAADAPKARYVTVVRDFVVSGNIYDATTPLPFRIKWSALNDETSWTDSATTQSDYQEIPDGGTVVGITGGEFGLIFMDRSIHRMSYVGSPLVFQFDNISRNLGCYEANSIIQYQGVSFFLSDDGFYACDGQNIIAIGNEKVNRYFYSDVDEVYLSNMSAAIDPFRNLVIWSYASKGQGGNVNRLLIYNFETKKWSSGSTDVDRVADASTPSVTLEGLDAFSTSIDALPTSLDSRQWIGGKMMFAGVRNAKIVTFTGANSTATIQTGDLSAENRKTAVTLVQPIVDNGSASVAISSRNLLSEQVTFGTATAADSENRVSIRSMGRYHQLEFTPSGANWLTTIGADVEIVPMGGR
jgi:hypothetical protein